MSVQSSSEVERLFGEATAAHGRGEAARAEGIYQEVLRHEEHHPGALLNLGILAQQVGRAEDALHWLSRAEKALPGDATVLNSLGNALRALGRAEEAASAYRSALTGQPGNISTLFNLASLLEDRGELPQAEECYRKAAALEPTDAGAWLGLGATILAQNKGDEALRCLRKAMDLAPGNLEVRIRCGNLLYEMNRYYHALEIFETIVAEYPDHMPAHDGVYQVYVKLGRGADAVEACRRAITHDPSSEVLYCNLALAFLQKGDLKEAIEACEKAIALNGNFARAYNCLGLVQMSGGESTAASESFQKALSLDPENTAYSFNFSHVRRFSNADQAEIDRIESLLAGRRGSGKDCADLHFALGKIYDDCGSYDTAFEHYDEANRSVSRRVRFHGPKFQQWCSRLHEAFTPELFGSRAKAGDPSTRAIFIVGMPRSGTTLVEQIIASHPQVHGAGELMKINGIIDILEARHGGPGSYPDCMRSIDSGEVSSLSREYLEYLSTLNPNAARVTDKLPENLFHLGFIAMLLPNAHVIYCRRDAMDVCLSNFTQRFFQGHNYSYDLDDVATYYLEHERIMAHWREVLPIRILDVDYESLVDNQEAVTRELISYCQLPWDQQCLAFHETKRAVNTASDWQVRRPIYKNSVKRWKNYEPHLEALKERLGYAESA